MVSYCIIPRMGNKLNAWKHIKDIFDRMLSYTKYYVEPFLGSGFVLRKVKQMNPDLYCLVGDIDGELSNFYIQAFMNTDEFVRLIRNAPLHEDLFNQFKAGNYPNSPLHRAFAFYYCSKLSGPSTDGVGGLVKINDKRSIVLNGVGRLRKNNIIDNVLNGIGGLVKINDKRGNALPGIGKAEPLDMSGNLNKNSENNGIVLRGIGGLRKNNTVDNVLIGVGGLKKIGDVLSSLETEFEQIMRNITYRTYYLQEDYEALIKRADKKYGRDNYVLYLDPPYIGTESYYSCGTFDHDHLREVVGDRENVMISYNDCPKARELYSDFDMKEFGVKKRKEVFFWKYKEIDILEI